MTTAKTEFGLSYSGDHFFNNNGPTFYDNEMNDLSMFQTFNDNSDFFSASSSSPQHNSSLDESFMFDSPPHSGSPMDDSVWFLFFFFRYSCELFLIIYCVRF